jgi:putative transposase
MAKAAVGKHGVSIILVGRTFSISETCYRYEHKLSDENAEITDRVVRKTTNRCACGFWLVS